jgi:myosin heavy subunit
MMPGKTEATKQVLEYLSLISSEILSEMSFEQRVDDSINIQQLVMSVNPITESFGNAQTIRNNNSSRFGKMIDLFYSLDGYIEGVHISTYLLETIRVTFQLPGERNYRIFYELDAGLSDEQKKEWSFQRLDDFAYINRRHNNSTQLTNQSKLSSLSAPQRRGTISSTETDLMNYNLLMSALRQIHFSEDEIAHICRAVIGILHLGNISFISCSHESGLEGAAYASDSLSTVEIVCDLLGLYSDSLLSALTRRQYTISTSKQTLLEKYLDVTSAVIARDALARTLYEVLFTRIIDRINSTLNPEGTQSEDHSSSISVLDVFGFEYYDDTNSFEQFSINYANEKLQDYFNFSIFKSQQELYISEGIIWKINSYPDSTERIDLFENKLTGILSLCDEILKLSSPNEKKLITNLYLKNHKLNPYFDGNKLLENNGEFIVKHYACAVKYQIHGWVEKNRSDIALEIKNCIFDSTNLILRSEFTDGPFLQLQIQQQQQLQPSSPFPSSLTVENGLISSSPGRRKSITITTKIKINSYEQRSLSLALDPTVNSTTSQQFKSFVSVGKKINTNLSQFSKELSDLLRKIHSMRSHFIRCIKPNATLSPHIFLPELILSQLRCGGTLQAIQVYQDGFPHKMSFQYFLSRYSAFLCLCGVNHVTHEVKDCINRAQLTGQIIFWRLGALKLIDVIHFTMEILDLLDEPSSVPLCRAISDLDLQQGIQIGKSSVFLRTNIYEHLESIYLYCVTMIAKRLQRKWRAYQYIKIFLTTAHSSSSSPPLSTSLALSLLSFSDHKLRRSKKLLFAVVVIQRSFRIYVAVKQKKVSLSGFRHLQALYRGYCVRQWVKRLKSRSATLVQTLFRKFYQKTVYRKKRCGVQILQRTTRRFLAMVWRLRAVKGIRLLQRVERGRQGRKQFNLLYTEQVRDYFNHPCVSLSLTCSVTLLSS